MEIIDNKMLSQIQGKLDLLADTFKDVLYEEDTTFIENMKNCITEGDDISRYMHWEWPQGVGLYGFWKYYKANGDKKYLSILEEYYHRQYQIGFPGKNVNTVAPLLALACYADEFKNDKYMAVCDEWAEWIMNEFPRTPEGGLQHITSDCINKGELWDDTLYMTVLFLAKMGKIRDKQDYIDEAVYQFLLHTKYLQDPVSGLWYHGWTFEERNNFAGAFWGRGNCWITLAIPELLSMGITSPEIERFLSEILVNQADALEKYQDADGMWHTLIDDSSSYLEASATAGFGYGLLRAIHMGLLDTKFMPVVQRALTAILGCINTDGTVSQVSYGTPMGRESKDFYKNIPLQSMPYGQALAMLFLFEAQAA